MIVRIVRWLRDLLGLSAPRPAHHVIGRVASRNSAGLGGLRVVLVDNSVGGGVELVAGETDACGHHGLAFSDAELRRGGKGRRRAALNATDDGSIRPEGRYCK